MGPWVDALRRRALSIAALIIVPSALATVRAFSADECEIGPNDVGSQATGECCVFSINCPAGDICNKPTDELFVSSKPENVCATVLCTDDAQCDAPKRCDRWTRLCDEPVCQIDAECPEVCTAGKCAERPSSNGVKSCTVVSPAYSVEPGVSVRLAALARNASGRIVPHVSFRWESSAPESVIVTATAAIGGPQPGLAQIRAIVEGRDDVSCDGPSIASFAPPEEGTVRIVVTDERTGLAVPDARVLVELDGSSHEARTNTDGVALFALERADSVSVVRKGFTIVTIISPETRDLLIPIAPLDDDAGSSGFGGSVELTGKRRGDISIGFVGRPIPENVLDLGRAGLFGDALKGATFAIFGGCGSSSATGCRCNSTVPPTDQHYGGYLLRLGACESLTQDRCLGAPQEGALGCALVAAPAGHNAVWSFAGRVSISSVSLTGKDDLFAGDPAGVFPVSKLFQLASAAPLLRHAAEPLVDLPQPETLGTRDFSKYEQLEILADTPAKVRSVISVRKLSREGASCPNGMLAIASAVLPGRGLLPLGIGFAEDEAGDCALDPRPFPSGVSLAPLPLGSVPLVMAPPHGGLEGSELSLLLIATNRSGGGPMSVLSLRRSFLAEEEDVSGVPFVAFKRVSISVKDKTIAFDEEPGGADLWRLDVDSPIGRWLVYAPIDAWSIELPALVEGRNRLALSTRRAVQIIRSNSPYSELWRLGAGKRLGEEVTAFAEQKCAVTGECLVE
jgi:hypothetical protein